MSEVRWIGFVETATQDGHKICFSGDEKKKQFYRLHEKKKRSFCEKKHLEIKPLALID